MRALKQGILNNNTLTSLNLSWNPLGRQGCFDMAELVEVRADNCCLLPLWGMDGWMVP